MTRQRTSSYVDSSEDDFAISDGGTSPQQSRLRRPRRPPKKPRQDAPRSPQTSSFHQVDSDDDVICVPDSLENQARQPSLDQHTSASKPNLDTSAENTMESIAESEQPASAGQVDSGKPNPREAHVHENDGAESKPTTTGKKRKSCAISDSESEASVHEDDDVYNSAADSVREEDIGSDFELSSSKKTKEKTAPKIAAKRSPPQKKSKTRATNKASVVKRTIVNVVIPMQSKNGKAQLAASSGKKRLGTRLPGSSALSSNLNTEKNPLRASSKLHPTPFIRSGLSRKANVPRLHSYLDKQ